MYGFDVKGRGRHRYTDLRSVTLESLTTDTEGARTGYFGEYMIRTSERGRRRCVFYTSRIPSHLCVCLPGAQGPRVSPTAGWSIHT